METKDLEPYKKIIQTVPSFNNSLKAIFPDNEFSEDQKEELLEFARQEGEDEYIELIDKIKSKKQTVKTN